MRTQLSSRHRRASGPARRPAARRDSRRQSPAVVASRAAACRGRRSAGPRSTRATRQRVPARRREQRLGSDGQIADRGPRFTSSSRSSSVVAEVAQHERVVAEHRAVDAARRAGARTPGRRGAASAGRGAARSASACVSRSRRSSLQRSNVCGVAGIGQRGLHLGRSRGCGNCARNSARPWRTSSAQLGVVVGEVEERRRRRELLALEQHRRRRAEQQQRRHARGSGPGSSARCSRSAAAGVRDLVVVLEEGDEARRRRGRAPACRGACFCQA